MNDNEKNEIRVMIRKEIVDTLTEVFAAVPKAGALPLPQIASETAFRVAKKRLRHAEADIMEKEDPEQAKAHRALDPEF